MRNLRNLRGVAIAWAISLTLVSCADGNVDDATDATDVPDATDANGETVVLPYDEVPTDTPFYAESPVFIGGEEGYPVYRIPSVAYWRDGVVVAFCEARQSLEDPGAGLIDVVMKRSEDCGKTWKPLEIIAENGDGDAHNPVTVVAPDASGEDVLWLFFNRRPYSNLGEFNLAPGLGDDSASIWVTKSADGGLTWSDAVNITASVKNPEWAIASVGPGSAIVTKWGGADTPVGRIVVPGWMTWENDDPMGGAFVFYSDDGGQNWSLGGMPQAGGDEAQLVELNDGTLILDSRPHRDTGVLQRFIYRSTDGGLNWSEPTLGLKMVRVMSSVIRYSAIRDGADRDILLHSGTSPKTREDVRIWASYDEGETWTNETILNDGIAQYSVLTRMEGASIGIIYETYVPHEESITTPAIVFGRLNLAKIEGQE